MTLRAREKVRQEEGYTLVETLVAMALFLSVLIPLGVAIGTLLLDKEAEKVATALLIAEEEMTLATLEKDLESRQFEREGGYMITREVATIGEVREILLRVSHRKKPQRALVTLHKTIVCMP